MAHILCVTDGLPSVVYRSVELARRLAAAGHRITYAGPAGARQLVENQGLDFVALEPSGYGRFLEGDAGAGVLARLLSLRRRRRQAVASLAVDGFVEMVRENAPDLVLINGELHEQILAARGVGAPIALLNTFVSIWRRPGLPPPHVLARPGVGWRGSRLGIALFWWALRLRKLGRAWWQRLRRVGCDRLALLAALARRGGLDLGRETDAGQWLIPFTYRHLPVLSLHALEFEFPHRPADRVRYVGPMVLEARVDRPLPEEDRARLEAILARCRRAGGNRRLIYAGFGSVLSTEPALLRRLLAVVDGRPDWELALSLSARLAAAELGTLPPRVHAFRWLPQLTVLRHADAMINHGGGGTVDECVLAGVPMLVYCGFETEMAGTTSRVVHHGLGIAGDRRDDTEALRRHLDRLLGEPRFRENVERLRPLYEAYVKERVVERAVEELLAGAGGADRVASPRGGAT